MTFPKPRNLWQWLALLSPTLVMVVCGTLIPQMIIASRRRSGNWVPRLPFDVSLSWAWYGLVASAALSLCLGFWLAPDESVLFRRVGIVIGYTLLIETISLLVSFPGCFAMGLLSG